MTPQEIVELCKKRITEHKAEGGKVIFEQYGSFSAGYPTGLYNNCGCALTIAVVPMLQAKDYLEIEEERRCVSELVSHYLNISDLEIGWFIQGFDEKPHEEVDMSSYSEEESAWYLAGIEVRDWILKGVDLCKVELIFRRLIGRTQF